MSNTLTTSINWAKSFLNGNSLSNFTTNEPALSSANIVRQMMLNAPLTWYFNRSEFTFTLTTGTQDYAETLTNFGFLEKAALTDTNGKIWEIPNVYNSQSLSKSTTQQRPQAIAVMYPGTGQSSGKTTFRFLGVPEQAYTCTLTYQFQAPTFTSLTDNWAPIPDYYSDIYNNLFLSYMMDFRKDERAAEYRARGVAALLSKAEGLTEMQRNNFIAQWMHNDAQQQSQQLKVAQGNQARGV